MIEIEQIQKLYSAITNNRDQEVRLLVINDSLKGFNSTVEKAISDLLGHMTDNTIKKKSFETVNNSYNTFSDKLKMYYTIGQTIEFIHKNKIKIPGSWYVSINVKPASKYPSWNSNRLKKDFTDEVYAHLLNLAFKEYTLGDESKSSGNIIYIAYL